MAIATDIKLLTASDVADLCEVDLKTIHNWVERGCIPHFRTPGRHLRFQAMDVATFLREWGYAIPRRFYAELAQTVMVIGAKETLTAVSRALGQAIGARHVPDLMEALLRIGAEPTSAVVIDAGIAERHFDVLDRVVSSLRRAYAVPVVIIGEPAAMEAIRDVIVVPPGDAKALRTALTGQSRELAPAQVAAPRRRARKPNT